MERRSTMIAFTGVCLILSMLAWPGTANAAITYNHIEIDGIVVHEDDGGPTGPTPIWVTNGGTVDVTIRLNFTGIGGAFDWRSTRFEVDGVFTCFDHENFYCPPACSPEMTFTVPIPEDSCHNVEFFIRCYGGYNPGIPGGEYCGTPSGNFSFAEYEVELGTLVVLPESPEPDCVGPFSRCLDEEGNTQATITPEDIYAGTGDPNCGEIRLIQAERRDPANPINWITSPEGNAVFTCADIGPQDVRLMVGDGLHPDGEGGYWYPENFGYCVTTVTIMDCNAPAICACFPTMTLAVDSSCVATLPDYRLLPYTVYCSPDSVPFWSPENLSDNCTAFGDLIVEQSPPAGTTYDWWKPDGCPDGYYEWVTITVTDEVGLYSTCQFMVQFTDDTLPTITCPADIDVDQDPTDCHATLTFAGPTVDDNCCVGYPQHDQNQLPRTPGAVYLFDNGDGTYTGTFPIGTTEIQWWVYDCCSNESEHCVQTVTVHDIEDPWIDCPDDLPLPGDPPIENDEDDCGAYVSLTPPCWGDNCDVQTVTNDYAYWEYNYVDGQGPPPDCTEPVSIWFPVGVTTVTWTITDMDGRTAQCSHTVEVVDTQLPDLGICEHYPGGLPPTLNLDFIEVNNPPCDSITPDEIMEQIMAADFGWWLTYAADDNCPDWVIYLINTTDDNDPACVPADPYPFVRRTTPYPLGISHVIFVVEDAAGNISSDWCRVQIIVVDGDCTTPPFVDPDPDPDPIVNPGPTTGGGEQPVAGNPTPKTEGSLGESPPLVDIIPVCNGICGCGMVQTLSFLFVGLVGLKFGVRRRR